MSHRLRLDAQPVPTAPIAGTPNALSDPTPSTNETYTLDNAAPTLTLTAPGDNASGRYYASDIALTFDDSAIQRGAGNIVLKLADGTIIESFDIATGAGSQGGSLGVAGGIVTLDPAAYLLAGDYYVEVDATAIKDAAGNSFAGISGSSAFNFTVTPPPAPAITAVTDDAGLQTGAIANGGSTDDLVLSLTGSAEANSLVSVYNGATLLGTTNADASGNWSYTTATLANGTTYAFNAKATDPASNTSAASADYSVTVDLNDAPTLSVTDPKGAGSLLRHPRAAHEPPGRGGTLVHRAGSADLHS